MSKQKERKQIQDTSLKKEEKSLYQRLKEMPYDLEKVGQAFVISLKKRG